MPLRLSGVVCTTHGTPFSRARRSLFVFLVLLLLCFMLVINVALQDVSSTTVQLDALHDPSTSITRPSETSGVDVPRARILLVSAMFPLEKSKHSKEEYAYWLSQFLNPITTDVYFFAPPSFAPTVQSVRGSGNITIDTAYGSPFDIPPLRGLEEKYRSMHNLDREKFRHSPELYAIWNAKPFFVHAAVQALRKQGKEYDYVFWNDAGSFRNTHMYSEWPDAGRVQQIWDVGEKITGTPKEKLLFFPLAGMPAAKMRYWKEDMGPVDYDVSEGSFFGGSPETIAWWQAVYYSYHDYYLSRGLFVGKDQTLINALFLLFPERVISVWFGDPAAPARSGLIPAFDHRPLGACGSEWFYYQFWMADSTTREKMRGLWMALTKWRDWEWWAKRQRCRLTGVVAMRDVLQTLFGARWTPPPRSVPLRTL
ncbi:hypothetical protein D9619_007998 [Psilocybe cf. subviscida]|uniref:Uncharacterized protein n=1 Tax=Psilocybe cf. subviscida TaxID=2480587 RepID=A0A8H5ATG3_9AGAR|nr:hypothetical protein D9619_007998 [Psilocybe cf. subviscida]